MALSRSTLLSHESASEPTTSSETTASFTPANNSLLLAIVWASGGNNDALAGGDITFTDSAGLTWTSRAVTTTHPNYGYGIRAFTAPVTTGVSMTVTMDAGAFSIHKYRTQVYQYTGHDTVSPVGATAIGSDADGTGAASITLSAAPATTSEVIAVCLTSLSGTTGAVDVGSGFSELFESGEAAWQIFQAQSRTGSTDTNVPWANVGNGSTALGSAMLAVEIKEGPIEFSGPFTSRPSRQKPRRRRRPQSSGMTMEADVQEWW